MFATWQSVASSIVILYGLTFLVLLPIICHNWPHSPYFFGSKSGTNVVRQIVRENDQRYEEARSYLSSLRQQLDTLELMQPVKSFNPLEQLSYDLVIGVVTMNRDNGGSSFQDPNSNKRPSQKQTPSSLGLGYLTQTVASLLKMLNVNEHLSYSSPKSILRRTKLFVCNVDRAPHLYKDPDEIKDLVEVVTRNRNATAARANRAYQSRDIFEREKDDYIYCLKQAVILGQRGGGRNGSGDGKSRYVMLFEDDVVADPQIIGTLEAVLRRRPRDELASLSESEDRWLFLKLYYPEKWLGYANEFDRIVELVCAAAVGGTLGCVVACALSSHFRFVFSIRRQRLRAVLLFTAFAVYTVFLCMGLGRPHTRAWRQFFSGYLHRTVPAPDCCTQAVLYPTRVVEELTQHLADQRCTIDYSIDIAIAGYARMRRLDAYLIDPNLVQHVGFVSSVRQYGKILSDFI